jgi:nucleoside-diphosphate-sugar epimerase
VIKLLGECYIQPVVKILILGSSGQVGSYLVEHLEQRGHLVIEFDIARGLGEDLRIFGNSNLEKVMKDSDFVFFLAFDVGGSHYLERYQDTGDFILNNLQLMTNTFTLLRKLEKKFIFASSTMSSMSHSTYGLLKAIGERATKSLGGKVVHFWNIYGYEKDQEKFHVISDFILKARETGKIDMRTTGKETREFLYAKDCCKGLELIMDRFDQIPPDMPLHLTSFNSITIMEIAQVIAKNYDVEVIPGIKEDAVHRGVVNIPDKAILKFWKPETNIESGIKEIIDKTEFLHKIELNKSEKAYD